MKFTLLGSGAVRNNPRRLGPSRHFDGEVTVGADGIAVDLG